MLLSRLLAQLAPLALTLATLPAAHATELYGQIGLPGVGLGVAVPLNSSFTLRGDFVTLGKRDENTTEEGIDYNGKLRAQRAALLADWYPLQGGLRFTGGVTFNKYQLDLRATGAGGTLTIGDTTYTTTADDRLDVQVKFPDSTPYIGLGWGHQTGSGLRFSADLGASIGRAKLTAAVSGPNAGNVSQEDLDKELAELREGVGKLRALPQISFAIGYSF